MTHRAVFQRRNVFYVWGTIIAVFVALLIGATPLLAQDAGPDFKAIYEPLNGEYELYTVDDLVISRTKPTNNNTGSAKTAARCR